jgi:RHS repeat-associated protein
MNVTALVDTDGDVVERYMYDPYGQVLVLNGADDADDQVSDWSEDADNTSDWDNELFFAGYRFDSETGLYHVRHRMYHPTLGRWIQRDPAGYEDGLSLYLYAGSNPALHRDPQGLTRTHLGAKRRDERLPFARGLNYSYAVYLKMASAKRAVLFTLLDALRRRPINIWSAFDNSKYGTSAGAGMAAVFFPDTCEIAQYAMFQGLVRKLDRFVNDGLITPEADEKKTLHDTSEIGAGVSASLGFQSAFYTGTDDASARSFAGHAHSLGADVPLPKLPVGPGASLDVGEPRKELEGVWLGYTKKIGVGAGLGLLTWRNRMTWRIDLDSGHHPILNTLGRCVCEALIEQMDDFTWPVLDDVMIWATGRPHTSAPGDSPGRQPPAPREWDI